MLNKFKRKPFSLLARKYNFSNIENKKSVIISRFEHFITYLYISWEFSRMVHLDIYF